MKRVALSAGHRNASRNTSPGNPCELSNDRTGHVTRAVATELRQRGFDVRVVQSDDGLGYHPGNLSDVGRQVVRWATAGWRANLFLEFHFEGNAAGDRARGAFLIYPDQQGEQDTDARRLAKLVCAGIQQHTGIPSRGDGDMAESETQVKQLGVLRALAPLKATLTRALVEVANCEAPSDRAIIQRPDFLERTARGVADGVCQFFGVALPSGTAQPEAEPLPPGVRRYRVKPGAVAIVRQGKAASYPEVERLAAGATVAIRGLVFDEQRPDRDWLHLDDQRGFVEASALERA